MSEAHDQPVVDAPTAGADGGVAAEAPATTPSEDDIDTESFDRMPAPDEDADAEAQAAQPAPETPPDKPQAGGEDEEEVELSDGRKVKVPKEVALGILRQGDYTKKTQELADARRTFETEQAQQLESLKTLRAEHLAIDRQESALAQIDKDLGQYRQLTPQDWAALKAQDPALYDQHMSNFEILRTSKLSAQENLDAAKKELKGKEASLSETLSAADQAKLKDAWEKANPVLAKEIPGWGADKYREIGEFIGERYGIKDRKELATRLEQSPDPVAWRMANDLRATLAENARLTAALKQKDTAATTAKALEVKPAAPPAKGAAQPRGLTDELPHNEWLRRRNAQVARKQA